MIKFTKDEISLCKQVAKKYRKEIEIGNWALFENKVRLILKAGFDLESPITGEKERFIIFDDPTIPNLKRLTIHLDRATPLWTISDCLEFLREKGWNVTVIEIEPGCDVRCFSEKAEVNKGYECRVEGEGKTPLEACLKAVLAVLEEGK